MNVVLIVGAVGDSRGNPIFLINKDGTFPRIKVEDNDLFPKRIAAYLLYKLTNLVAKDREMHDNGWVELQLVDIIKNAEGVWEIVYFCCIPGSIRLYNDSVKWEFLSVLFNSILITKKELNILANTKLV